jgi:signal transduction histidine kinase
MIGTILDNAVKYTPKNGEITVQIEQDAKQAKIIITDSGEGISEEERVRVFDRFYRIPSTKQPGSGLGLSIARQIAHMLGADITLETPKISKGLRVSIILASS